VFYSNWLISRKKPGTDCGRGFRDSSNPHLEIAEAARAYDLEVKVFPCKGRLDRSTIQSIGNYLDREKIQIIHSHNYKSNYYARESLLPRKVRWSLQIMDRDPDPNFGFIILWIPSLFEMRTNNCGFGKDCC